jgi:hypothetical protein
VTRGPGLLPLAIMLLCGVSALQSAGAVLVALGAGPGQPHPGETGYGALQMLVFLAAGIASAVWLYRAQQRVRALGAEALSVGPVGQILWFVVPIATLFMPVRGVSELRRASIDPRDWEAVAGSLVLKLWWACWLISGTGNAAALKAAMETDPGFPAVGWWGSTVADLFSAPAALCFAALVVTIDARLARLESGAGPIGQGTLRAA